MRTIIPPNAKLLPAQAERVFKGKIFDVYHWQQQVFDGTTETFEMLKRPDTVKVIAIKDDKIVILEEEQPHHAPFFDIPGGRHDHENETELQAAQRELLEETGMTFATWRLIDVSQPHGKIDWLVYIFLADNFVDQVAANLDAGEKIIVKLLSLEEVKQLASNPETRYLPQLITEIQNIQQLEDWPEYTPA